MICGSSKNAGRNSGAPSLPAGKSPPPPFSSQRRPGQAQSRNAGRLADAPGPAGFTAQRKIIAGIRCKSTATSRSAGYARPRPPCGSARTPRPRSCRGSRRAGPGQSSPIDPSANACTTRLPMAVAWTGPASTCRPEASAAAWQSRRFFVPPPTTWIVSIPPAGQRLASCPANGGSSWPRCPAPCGAPPLRPRGTVWPVRRQKPRMASGMLSGARNRRRRDR